MAIANPTDVEEPPVRLDAEDRTRMQAVKDRMRNDPDYARAERDRIRRIRSDTTLPEPLRAMYLDATILDTREIKELADVSLQKVHDWRKPLQKDRREPPHPRILPHPDVVLGFIAGKEITGTKRGKIIEWLIDTHRFLYDEATGTIYKNPNASRHGGIRTRA